jgi:hypothetical protein
VNKNSNFTYNERTKTGRDICLEYADSTVIDDFHFPHAVRTSTALAAFTCYFYFSLPGSLVTDLPYRKYYYGTNIVMTTLGNKFENQVVSQLVICIKGMHFITGQCTTNSFLSKLCMLVYTQYIYNNFPDFPSLQSHSFRQEIDTRNFLNNYRCFWAKLSSTLLRNAFEMVCGFLVLSISINVIF